MLMALVMELSRTSISASQAAALLNLPQAGGTWAEPAQVGLCRLLGPVWWEW
jgi:hypothetical protein